MTSNVRPGRYQAFAGCNQGGLDALCKKWAGSHLVRIHPADFQTVNQHSLPLLRTQESLHQQERILGRGYEEVLASLRQCAGQHPVSLSFLPTTCLISALKRVGRSHWSVQKDAREFLCLKLGLHAPRGLG